MEKLFMSKKGNINEVDSLRLQLTLYKIFGTVMSIMCCFLGLALISNNNKLISANADAAIDYEAKIQTMEQEYYTTYNNYEYLAERYSSFLNTISELTAISEKLDEENQQLVASNQEYYDELQEFKSREELYNKYEWALYDGNTRNDITFDQLVTLEEMVQDSSIDDQDFLLAIVMTESRGNEKAQNPTSTAKGYGQFLNSTSKFVYTDLLGRDNWSPSVALDGDTNLQMMVAYTDYLYKQNNGNLYGLIQGYRGLEDCSSYIREIDKYLANVDKSVHDIYLAYNK